MARLSMGKVTFGMVSKGVRKVKAIIQDIMGITISWGTDYQVTYDATAGATDVAIAVGIARELGPETNPFVLEPGNKYYFEFETIGGTGYMMFLNDIRCSYNCVPAPWARVGFLLDFSSGTNIVTYHIVDGVPIYVGDTRWQTATVANNPAGNILRFAKYNTSGDIYRIFFTPKDWTTKGALNVLPLTFL